VRIILKYIPQIKVKWSDVTVNRNKSFEGNVCERLLLHSSNLKYLPGATSIVLLFSNPWFSWWW